MNNTNAPNNTVVLNLPSQKGYKDVVISVLKPAACSNPSQVLLGYAPLLQPSAGGGVVASAAPPAQVAAPQPASTASSRVMYKVLYPHDLDLLEPFPKMNRRGRPRKHSRAPEPDPSPDFSSNTVLKAIRTRSGRVTKPPRFMAQNARPGDEEEAAPEAAPPPDPPQPLPRLEFKKRTISARFICPTCKKAYLGYARMSKHLLLNPTHGPVPNLYDAQADAEEVWAFLVNRAKRAPASTRARTALSHLGFLVRKAREAFGHALKPATGHCDDLRLEEGLAKALGVAPGVYSVQEAAPAAQAPLQSDDLLLTEVASLPNHSHDLILPSQDLDLQSVDPSDEVMSVDQLVSERLQSLTDAELAPPNPSTALNLDLTLDLFPFHPS